MNFNDSKYIQLFKIPIIFFTLFFVQAGECLEVIIYCLLAVITLDALVIWFLIVNLGLKNEKKR